MAVECCVCERINLKNDFGRLNNFCYSGVILVGVMFNQIITKGRNMCMNVCMFKKINTNVSTTSDREIRFILTPLILFMWFMHLCAFLQTAFDECRTDCLEDCVSWSCRAFCVLTLICVSKKLLIEGMLWLLLTVFGWRCWFPKIVFLRAQIV